MRQSTTPVAGFANMSVLVCLVRWSVSHPTGWPHGHGLQPTAKGHGKKSVGSLQKLELKSSSWPGSALLGDKFKIRARLGSGSKACGVSKLTSAQARKEGGFPS